MKHLLFLKMPMSNQDRFCSELLIALLQHIIRDSNTILLGTWRIWFAIQVDLVTTAMIWMGNQFGIRHPDLISSELKLVENVEPWLVSSLSLILFLYILFCFRHNQVGNERQTVDSSLEYNYTVMVEVCLLWSSRCYFRFSFGQSSKRLSLSLRL